MPVRSTHLTQLSGKATMAMRGGSARSTAGERQQKGQSRSGDYKPGRTTVYKGSFNHSTGDTDLVVPRHVAQAEYTRFLRNVNNNDELKQHHNQSLLQNLSSNATTAGGIMILPNLRKQLPHRIIYCQRRLQIYRMDKMQRLYEFCARQKQNLQISCPGRAVSLGDAQ